MSGTNLLSLATGTYDPRLTVLMGIEEMDACLPPLVPSFGVRGYVTAEAAQQTGLPVGIPVSGGMFDIDACAFGAGTIAEGEFCAIAGTWSINEYISRKPLDGVMNSFWCDGGLYLVEESSAASAGNLEWVKDLLKESAYDCLDALVSSVPPQSSAAVFLPFLYASNLHPYAKASLLGLESGYTEAEVLRAVYEGVAFSSYTHLERLFSRMDALPPVVKLTGGVNNSLLWSQLFADVIGIPVEVTQKTEIGCKGAAMSAGIAAGIYADGPTAVARCVRPGTVLTPDPVMTAVYREKYRLYRQAEEALAPFWQNSAAFKRRFNEEEA